MESPPQNPEQDPGQDPGPDLVQQVARLTQRVYRLESALRSHGISIDELSPQATAPAPPPAPYATQPETRPAPPPAPPLRPLMPPPSLLAQQSQAADSSLESRIGSQWFNRIGILAVLIAMAWFLKLAIDNHWIGPSGRVLIGIVAGVALIAWSERFRSRGFAGFSYSLKAVGSGILYLSLWAAYSLFHLIPASVAFLAMVLVTAFNGLMSWTRDSELLALYALIGGYITPLLLSSGQNHELSLFSYLLILNLATLALSVLRPWSYLLAAAYVGTLFYFAVWSLSFYSSRQFVATAFFLAVFFLLFAFAPRLVRTAGIGSTAPPRDIFALRVLPFANASLGFLAFYVLLDGPKADATQSWVAAIFAAFYFAMAKLPGHLCLDRRESGDSLLRAFDLLIAVALLAFALGLAIHYYWWSVPSNGNPAFTRNIGIYAQFTYSACFMLFGAVLLIIGFTRRVPILRWEALIVLAITIAKVFLVDITELNEAYRVLSFLGLGVLLIAISFAYQRDWLNLRRQLK